MELSMFLLKNFVSWKHGVGSWKCSWVLEIVGLLVYRRKTGDRRPELLWEGSTKLGVGSVRGCIELHGCL